MRWFVENKTVGRIKKKINWMLYKHYKFSAWHIEPINNKAYGIEVVRMLNGLIDKGEFEPTAPFVEIGCGLGDIIGNLRWGYRKIGYDLSAEVLRGGGILHPQVVFYQGSFKDVKSKNISCLIMVNFIHMISEDVLKKEINHILQDTEVRMFVIDTFRNNENTEYRYSHKGEYLFGKEYKLLKRSGGFSCAHGAKRYIEYWEKRKGR